MPCACDMQAASRAQREREALAASAAGGVAAQEEAARERAEMEGSRADLAARLQARAYVGQYCMVLLQSGTLIPVLARFIRMPAVGGARAPARAHLPICTCTPMHAHVRTHACMPMRMHVHLRMPACPHARMPARP